MGKIKIKTLGNEEEELKQKEEAKIKREEKIKREVAAGKQAKTDEEKAIEGKNKTAEKKAAAEEKLVENNESSSETTKKKAKVHARGVKYVKSATHVDANKKYDVKSAIALLKKMKYSSFDETIEVHMNLRSQNIKGEVALPHGTGKSVRVTIADDAVIADIEKGVVNFDILLATPAFMPKLVKLARVLGPKGLMPNPKNGTVTPNPEEAMKKFAGGTIRFKSEPKFPLLHQAVGKSSFEDTQLVENIVSIYQAVGKNNVVELFISSTMTPSVHIDLEKI